MESANTVCVTGFKCLYTQQQENIGSTISYPDANTFWVKTEFSLFTAKLRDSKQNIGQSVIQ